MGSDVVLSAGVRQNLLSLQSTAQLMSITQNRLATGKKVNSALDNPVNFFTSSGLTARAGDLSALLDSMENGIKTIEAADNGITSIKSTIESMKSTLLQARQDKSFKSSTYSIGLTTPAATDVLALSGGAVTGTVNVDLTNSQGVRTGAAYTALDFNDNANNAFETLSFSIAANGGTARAVTITATNDTTLSVTIDGGPATTFATADSDAVTGAELAGALNAAFDAAVTPVPITAAFGGGALSFTSDVGVSSSSANVTVTGIGTTDAAVLLTASFGFNAGGTLTQTGVVAQTVDELVNNINANANLTDKVSASNDSGRLRISNLSTGDLTLVGATVGGVINGDTGAVNTATIGGNVVRRNLVKQYNDLRDQLNKLADDSSFNGINLLRGDKLRINFNELGTSSIIVQAQDEFGTPRPINTTTLGIDLLLNADVDADLSIDSFLDDLAASLNTLRSQASSFGSNLSLVEIRTEFTKKMINTLQVGADNLVLADTNEEGANMLALQTRQQLSTTALSLASQADQAVLRLFG
ncbi:MAG: flagellar protein [Xanthobacteraceae bacterium]|nr:flagellar protein [Xanthobacteraceae bacterium]